MIRNLRFLFTVTAMVAALSFALTGCELEEDTDATDTAVTPTDTAGGTDTNIETFQDYTYVRIDDLSDKADTPDGGADIDAISGADHVRRLIVPLPWQAIGPHIAGLGDVGVGVDKPFFALHRASL